MYDILILNGTVLDGTENPGKLLDVAIQKDKIIKVGDLKFAKAKEIIDAKGKYATPGFIDIQNHSDSYWTLFDQPKQASLLSQGITTIITGNCGSSLAPLPNREALKSIQKWHSLSGLNFNWMSFADFFETLSTQTLGVNVGSLIGHATIRRGLVGDEVRALTIDEIKIQNEMLRQGLEEGAMGMSLGLVYAHEVDSSFDELSSLVSTLNEKGKFLSVHLRSEGSHILQALDEVLDLSRKTSIPIKISHLKIRGKKNWHLFDLVIDKLENAYHHGTNVSFDVYPYATSWSVLYTYLPRWAYEGGRDQVLAHLANNLDRRKIIDYLKDQGHDFDNLIVTSALANNSFVGKSIKQIAINQNVSSEEAVLNVLSGTRTQVSVFDHNLSDEQAELLMTSPLSVIATDGAGYDLNSDSFMHPRCFGTMPKFLRLIRDKKLMSWERAIGKITSDPAKILNLANRGNISEGKLADIVVFDPLLITEKSTYEHPNLISEGIEAVLVNGVVSFRNGEVLQTAGEVLYG